MWLHLASDSPGEGLTYAPRRLTGNSESAQETANAGICSAANALMSNDAFVISTASGTEKETWMSSFQGPLWSNGVGNK
jgi:hypothetical protein